MAFNLVQEIRKKNREQWRETLWEKVTNSRIWIQENGELAFLAAIILGVLMATFFKVFAFLAAIAIITGFGIYLIARPEYEIPPTSTQYTSDFPRVDTRATRESLPSQGEPIVEEKPDSEPEKVMPTPERGEYH